MSRGLQPQVVGDLYSLGLTNVIVKLDCQLDKVQKHQGGILLG